MTFAARRERELASGSRAGAWAAGKARRTQRRFIRRNWLLLVAAYAIIVVPTLAMLPFARSGFQRGLLTGVAFSGATAVVAYLVMQATGSGPTMMGATAEQWTASELRPLRKRGWRVVNHLALQRWDIDHVLVGPAGAWAVETKWSAQPWRLQPVEERVRTAVERTRRNATNLRLWQPFKAACVSDVEPLVVLWGATTDDESPDAPVARRVDGVLVLIGVEGLTEWRNRLLARGPVLTPERVDAAWRAIDAHAKRRDEYELAEAPVPPSVMRMYVSGLAFVAAALGGFLLSLHALTWMDSWWAWLALSVPAAGVGWLASRMTRVRWPAIGWLIGWGASMLLVACAVIADYL